MQGTVKWYDAGKGFGFVAPADGGKDVFVHATALERSGLRGLNEGQTVRMQVVQGRKGPEASTISAE
ncbi:cold-shock protein [Roseococcus sp. MDT2-1-1]|uniref:Cold-shock protein n=2 Tax=Sabulicella glaciei TaxID=2984948 RepID=A0ABT3NTX0_9PROT|nr:cold-shock protein [Roseococcus sp. MDT2-1-1]